MLIAVPWAALILWLGFRESDMPELHIWIIALAPLAAPWLIARAARFVVTGSPAKRRRIYRGQP